jgi:eukaryotic-like serine/threonine-protein kinase
VSLTFKDPLLGKTIAQRYRLIQRLGAGGMASVYLARHVMIERLSAIKLVHPELGNNPDYKGRFLREAKAVNRINHPNIVEISDYGEADGLVYLVMEYIPGESLLKALERGPLGWRRAAVIGLQVASALGRAHQMGVIHRDLKPGNVLLVAQRQGDQVKLTDFGVAKMVDATTLTNTAVALGTPGYVAPEYRDYGSLDSRSDLFSLGVVLYETTCGALPFDPNASSGTAAPQRLSRRSPDIPSFFEEIVSTLLAADPDDRPRDGFEAYDLLKRLVDREGLLPSPDPPPFSPRSEVPPSMHDAPASSDVGRARERGGPHLTTVSFDRIAPLCSQALARLDATAKAAGSLAPRAAAGLAEVRQLVAIVRNVARLVGEDGEAVKTATALGRAVRAELGHRLDEIGREHSKTLGWAGTIAERTYQVQSARVSGEHPIPAVEAMVWEQAALEQEEDRVRERARELSAKMAMLQTELDRQNERLDHEMLVATARLDGRIAALRSIALEASISIEDAAREMDLAPATVWSALPAR